MRVHSLTVTAFGPFAGTVQVDLDELSRDGLFLLCGPTGAGKTSLLDAIAFALYGRVPGARGQEKRLRSDHSLAAVRTEVVCELTLRGERIRIRRRPEQVRPKARGEGTTKDQALLHVQRQVAGFWEPVSIRLDEGGDYLRERIGLSPEQFWQVVLLPQGEFAEFLRAEPDQRAKVLETLFDAGRFTDVEDWLAEHASTARAALTLAQDTVDRLLHRVEQAARGLPAPRSGDELTTRPATIEDSDRVRAYVSSQLDRASAARAAANSDDGSTAAALAAAETERDLGRGALRAADRLLAVCRQRDFLSAGADDLAERRTRLVAAQAAEPLRPFLDRDVAARAQVRAVATDLTEAFSDLVDLDVADQRPVRLQTLAERHSARSRPVVPSTGHTRGGTRADPRDSFGLVTVTGDGAAGPQLRRWTRALRDEVARLADRESELQAVEAEELSLAELVQAQAQRQASLDELDEIGGQLPAALAALEEGRAAALVSAAGVPHAASALRKARAGVQAATRAEQLQTLIATATANRVDCERVALAAKAEWLSLREARLAGIAAELAGQLADGQACPVCGSAEHPSPAVPAETIVTAADEQAAADRHDVLEQASQSAASAVAELSRDLDACHTLTSGQALDVVRELLSAAVAADLAARSAAEQLPDLDRNLAELRAGQAEVAARIGQLTKDQAEDRATAKVLRPRVGVGRRRLDRARGEDASLSARSARLAALARAAEALEETGSAYSSALAAARSSRTQLEDRLRRSNIDGVQAAMSALLDDQVRAELSAAIREHEDRQTGVAAELTSATEEFLVALAPLAECARLEQPPAPESIAPGTSKVLATQVVAEITQHLHDARTRLDGAHRAAAQARERAVAAISRSRGILNELDSLRVLVGQALAECFPLGEASAQATALAALVAGGGANVKKMRLRSYVLAARLEQVAAAATARLRQMSSSRYGFVHSADLRGGNRRSGLSVDILDGHTGTQRPTKTLSGGESFMASLALALGLADVVTAESGGIALDTLFVDEGFGSLDPESLDAVMTVLDELRQGGRVVGIVSHVEELRSRVPMQLQIRVSSHGSTLDQSEEPGVATGRLLAG